MRKQMKRLCCLCLALLLVFSLSACRSKKNSIVGRKMSATDDADRKDEPEVEPDKNKETEEPYTKGMISGNRFESEWLNIQADFPEQYIMATEDEIAQLQSKGADQMMTEEGQEMIDKSQEMGNVTYEMMAVALSGNPNCTLAVERLPFKNFTAKQYLEITKQNLLKTITDDYKIVIKGIMPTVTIAEEEYTCLQAVMYMNGMEMNSNTYVRVKDGYAIVINATFNADTEQKKDELLATFKPL